MILSDMSGDSSVPEIGGTTSFRAHHAGADRFLGRAGLAEEGAVGGVFQPLQNLPASAGGGLFYLLPLDPEMQQGIRSTLTAYVELEIAFKYLLNHPEKLDEIGFTCTIGTDKDIQRTQFQVASGNGFEAF